MKKYYGLRVALILYLSLAFVVAIFTVGATGFVLAQGQFNIAEIDWRLAMAYLVVGGLLSFTSYVLSQLIDVTLTHYAHNHAIDKELDQIREYADRTYKMQQWQVEVLKQISSQDEVSEALLERAKRLAKKEQSSSSQS